MIKKRPSKASTWDAKRVWWLKASLDKGMAFAKHDREYIEAAYEQLCKGVSLSTVQSYVINTIRELGN